MFKLMALSAAAVAVVIMLAVVVVVVIVVVLLVAAEAVMVLIAFSSIVRTLEEGFTIYSPHTPLSPPPFFFRSGEQSEHINSNF